MYISPFLTLIGRNDRIKSKKTIATKKGDPIMATSSFEKDFIVTDKQAPLWEKALAHFENKKIEWTPAKNRRVPREDLVEFLKKVKS